MCLHCVVLLRADQSGDRTSASVLAEARELAGMGYTKIQLLGQTVNSYRDPSADRAGFAELLRAVAAVPGIRRVRFTTSHHDLSADIVDAMNDVPAICEHLHLPAQSGSSRILEAMRRNYTREEYLEKIAMVPRR